MQLTGRQIIDRNIIEGIEDPEQIQQQGIDVRAAMLFAMSDKGGFIPKKGKTKIPNWEAVPTSFSDGKIYPCIPVGTKYWYLEPGYYEVRLKEGCNIPNNATLHFKTRSSLVRCGAQVLSGQFDAGFHTDAMGCFLHCSMPIYIEQDARIAQALVFETAPVESGDMYDGQWQGDKQRG